MVETHESVEEIEILLERARSGLGAFEEGVDYRRLLERLRTSSPAHPVLLLRFAFGLLAMVCVVAGIVVMVVPMIDVDLARTLVKFEAVIPYVPDGVPALPAVFALLAMCFFTGWAMCTGAALAIGREAHMLPWEQRQHQQLVNEVTRLTTQRAVMERIRNTPVSSRPRIATPSVLSMRSPGPVGRSGGDYGASGFNRVPTPGYGGRVDSAPPMAAAGPSANPGGWTPSGFQRPTYPSAPPPPGAAPSYGTPAGAPAPPPYVSPAPHSAAHSPAAQHSALPAPPATPAAGPRGTPHFAGGRQHAPPERDPWETPPGASATPPIQPAAPLYHPNDRSSSAATEHGAPPAMFHREPDAPTTPGFRVPPAPAEPPPALHAPDARGLQVHALASRVDEPQLEEEIPGYLPPPAVERSPAPPARPVATPDDEPTTVRAPDEPIIVSAPPATPLQAEVAVEGLVSLDEPPPEVPVRNGGIRLGTTTPDEPPMYGGVDDDDVPTAVREPSPDRSPRRPTLTPDPRRPTIAPAEPQATLRKATMRPPEIVDPSATLPPPAAAQAAAPPTREEEATTRRTVPASRAVPPPPPVPPAAAAASGTADPSEPADNGNGILARARAGAYGARATPAGSAGRIRPIAQAPPPGTGAPPPSVRERRRVGQQITPLGAPDTRPAARKPHRRKRSHQTILEEDDDAPTVLSSLVDHEESSVSPVVHAQPDATQIADQWLRDAVDKAQQLGQNFPVQAQLAYSREPNLPFTLLINRATPAMAVRAMVNFVEFLAGIYTPPRARIELHGVAHLDKSFHRNVLAALEPYFGNNVIVEPTGGMVDIRFTDPDPGWGQYPTLPLR